MNTQDWGSVQSAVLGQMFVRRATSKHTGPYWQLFHFFSLTERWRGQSNRWQEEAHPGLNPKPTLQRLSGLCWAIWGKNFSHSSLLCGEESLLRIVSQDENMYEVTTFKHPESGFNQTTCWSQFQKCQICHVCKNRMWFSIQVRAALLAGMVVALHHHKQEAKSILVKKNIRFCVIDVERFWFVVWRSVLFWYSFK